MQGFRFEQIAIAKGFITSEQLEEAKRIQKRVSEAGLETELEEIFVKKKWLTPAQMAAVHALMGVGDRELVRGYEILCRLGQGGMGTVYKAKHLALETTVAIKILLPHFASEKDAVERFRREASILAELQHPNIVKGLDAGFQNGVYYYVMEYIEGISLSQKVNQVGALPWQETVGYMKQMGEALIYAAKMEMVHRDIKPDNILINREGVAKLTDLGLAKMNISRPHTTLTKTGWMVGTPAYMSPEQMTQGKDADVRSDIYSLGMTFFTVLSGTPAYQGDTTISVMQQRMTHDIPYKKLNTMGVPDGLISIIRFMTAKDRAYRYQTPEDLHEDLRLVQRGETPIHAKKLPTSRSATQRITQKFLSMPPPPPPPPAPDRKRTLIYSLAIVIVALITVGYGVHRFTSGAGPKEDSLVQAAVDFETAHPDLLEDALKVYQETRAKLRTPAQQALMDEKISASRARLKKAMDDCESRLKETVTKHLGDHRPEDARKAIDTAASLFRCDEWKAVCRAIEKLIQNKSQ